MTLRNFQRFPHAAGFLGDAALAAVFAATIAVSSITVSSRETVAADWPQFLGANRDGASKETGLLDGFSAKGPDVVWRVSGGVGMSAVVVADGAAITTWNDQGQQWLVALDARTGNTRWKTPLGDVYENAMGNGPRATPAVAEGMVFAYTGEGILCAVEQQSGKLKWQRNAVADFEGQPSEYGMSASPLVYNGRVIVHVGGRNGAVAAFDAASGEPVWGAGMGPAGYSSPTLMKIGGEEQIVSITGEQLVGIEPNLGTVLWSYDFPTDYACNTATPVSVDGKVFVSAGENHGCALIDVVKQNGKYVAKELWSSLDTKSVMRNEWQTSVVVDGYLYGFDNVGAAGPVTHLACIEIKTGKPVWQEKRFGKGNLILADGKLWITTMAGELVLVKVSPKGYQELGRAAMFGKTRQTLSIANGRGYIRDDAEVLCLQLAVVKP
jgi:outer membrane protein assembly factor BamB